MNRAVILSLSLLSAAFFSCKDDRTPSDDPAALITMDYSITRTGVEYPPLDKTTYTFISYRDGASNEPDPTVNQQAQGTYAYVIDATGGILVPCNVETEYPYKYVSRNPDKGQRLTAGNFMTGIFLPAVPVVYNEKLGSTRILFTREQEVLALDMFPVTVYGYQVFNFPASSPAVDIRAKVSFNIVQGADTKFTIENAELRHAGVYGWYHPKLAITDITDDPDTKKFDPPAKSEPCVFEGPAVGGEGNTIYQAKDIYVFAANYSDETRPSLILAFDLQYGSSDNIYPITIPITVDMMESTHYTFTLIVESTEVAVSYTVRKWKNGYNDDGQFQEIGGEGQKIDLGTWNIRGWVPGGGGGGNIG